MENQLIKRIPISELQGYKGLFRCDCGVECIRDYHRYMKEREVYCDSCSSDRIVKRKTKHGLVYTKSYRAWHAMKCRCLNKKGHAYKDYGGRGITFDKKWYTFEGFYEDMKHDFMDHPDYSLDRIDNSKGYYKENCRWATIIEQLNNTRRNIFITFNNETLPLSFMCKKYGIEPRLVYFRIRRGWSIEKSMTAEKKINQFI